MVIEDFVRLVQDVWVDFEREEDQGLRQHDIHKAEHALAGKDACSRILRAVEARTGVRIIELRKSGRAR